MKNNYCIFAIAIIQLNLKEKEEEEKKKRKTENEIFTYLPKYRKGFTIKNVEQKNDNNFTHEREKNKIIIFFYVE